MSEILSETRELPKPAKWFTKYLTENVFEISDSDNEESEKEPENLTPSSTTNNCLPFLQPFSANSNYETVSSFIPSIDMTNMNYLFRSHFPVSSIQHLYLDQLDYGTMQRLCKNMDKCLNFSLRTLSLQYLTIPRDSFEKLIRRSVQLEYLEIKYVCDKLKATAPTAIHLHSPNLKYLILDNTHKNTRPWDIFIHHPESLVEMTVHNARGFSPLARTFGNLKKLDVRCKHKAFMGHYRHIFRFPNLQNLSLSFMDPKERTFDATWIRKWCPGVNLVSLQYFDEPFADIRIDALPKLRQLVIYAHKMVLADIQLETLHLLEFKCGTIRDVSIQNGSFQKYIGRNSLGVAELLHTLEGKTIETFSWSSSSQEEKL